MELLAKAESRRRYAIGRSASCVAPGLWQQGCAGAFPQGVVARAPSIRDSTTLPRLSPCLTSGSTLAILWRWKRTLSASDSLPTPGRAQGDFLSLWEKIMARYFVVGHGTDDGATSFVPARTRLLLYAPPGHNLEFTVGLSVLAAATSQSVQETIGVANCPNLELRNLEPAEQDAVGKNYGRSKEGELVIVGRDCASKIRLCSQPKSALQPGRLMVGSTRRAAQGSSGGSWITSWAR
jgi:hypothetical protein